MTGQQERYADKIAKLLRKAENPAVTPQEAEAFLAKAQELMTQWGIDEALIAKAAGQEVKEEIVEEIIKYTGVYHAALFDIGWAIARANDCKSFIGRRGSYTTQTVVGFKSDVERVKMLDTSAQIQATGALTKWWAEQNSSYMTAMQKFKARREFLFGFANGLHTQLIAAKKKGEKAAAQSEAERAGVSATEASESVALVVKSRKERVEDWVDKQYGRSLRGVSRNYASGGRDARAAGSAAGRKADISNRGGVRGGSRGELGR